MRWWVAIGALGCAEAQMDPTTGALPDAVMAIGLTDDSCAELVEVTFLQGGQGGFHTIVGVATRAPSPDVVMSTRITDPETGELLAEASDVFISLADWDSGDGQGWVGVQTLIGNGADSPHARAVVCSMATGRPVRVEGIVGEIGTDARSTVLTDVEGWFDAPGLCL